MLRSMSETLLPMFSSTIFMVSGLTSKYLIHFEFILVCGVRRWPSFIILTSLQFSQHHLLNKLSLAHWMCLLPLSNINWLKVWVYFWVVCSVPVICVSVFMPVPCCLDYYGLVVQFNSRWRDSSNFVLPSQDCCCYTGPFVVPYKF